MYTVTYFTWNYWVWANDARINPQIDCVSDKLLSPELNASGCKRLVRSWSWRESAREEEVHGRALPSSLFTQQQGGVTGKTYANFSSRTERLCYSINIDTYTWNISTLAYLLSLMVDTWA